jgi:hypothetical protein
MKRELALQLLSQILPNPPWNDEEFQNTFDKLRILADYKYNRYEMYEPGRLFFENLYTWLSRFKDDEKTEALRFIERNLIFISREEFQQLSQIVYHDRVKQEQLNITSEKTRIPRFKVLQLATHEVMKKIQRASLYVAMSDGARIDYFRRQNLGISNEQVLPSYEPSSDRIKSLMQELQKEYGSEAKFDCLFLLDDFTASGKTLLREVIEVPLDPSIELDIPNNLKFRVKYDADKSCLEFAYSTDAITEEEEKGLLAISEEESFKDAVKQFLCKNQTRTTSLKGSLKRLSKTTMFTDCLAEDAKVYFCPLLITEYAHKRLLELIPKIDNSQLSGITLLPGAIIPNAIRITDDESTANAQITTLCKEYYSKEDIEDEHTGNVMFGYDKCGLPIVLHHNTPNNSIYLLWSRLWKTPLFIRYERHGRK